MAKRKDFHNSQPLGIPEDAPVDAVRAEFARRLQQAAVEKGWNQSELARRAAAYTPDNKFGRDNVSSYMRGLNLPRPTHLHALCKALGKKPQDLLPSRGVPSVDDTRPPFKVEKLANGQAWLHINQAVDWPVAMQIMKILGT